MRLGNNDAKELGSTFKYSDARKTYELNIGTPEEDVRTLNPKVAEARNLLWGEKDDNGNFLTQNPDYDPHLIAERFGAAGLTVIESTLDKLDISKQRDGTSIDGVEIKEEVNGNSIKNYTDRIRLVLNESQKVRTAIWRNSGNYLEGITHMDSRALGVYDEALVTAILIRALTNIDIAKDVSRTSIKQDASYGMDLYSTILIDGTPYTLVADVGSAFAAELHPEQERFGLRPMFNKKIEDQEKFLNNEVLQKRNSLRTVALMPDTESWRTLRANLVAITDPGLMYPAPGEIHPGALRRGVNPIWIISGYNLYKPPVEGLSDFSKAMMEVWSESLKAQGGARGLLDSATSDLAEYNRNLWNVDNVSVEEAVQKAKKSENPKGVLRNTAGLFAAILSKSIGL